MGWYQRAPGSCCPNLERVRCEFSLQQLDHLAGRQAMADQDSLVGRPVIPGGCNHTFDLCGGHSGDRSGHRLIVCHVVARPKRCVSEPNSLICRLIFLGARVFNARRERECAAEPMGLEAPDLIRALEATVRCIGKIWRWPRAACLSAVVLAAAQQRFLTGPAMPRGA